MSICEQCGMAPAAVYAIDRIPGGWGGYYCEPCAEALQFKVVDTLQVIATLGDGCTCTYGAYAKIGGGSGFDICKYDPACPEHGWDEREQARRELQQSYPDGVTTSPDA